MSDDTRSLLQHLIELQTESLRLQRLLVDRLAEPPEPEPEPERGAEAEPGSEAEPGAEAETTTEAELERERQRPRQAEQAGRPRLRVVGGAAQRYYNKPNAPPAQAAVSLERLETLRAIHDAGDTARLVLGFGPHAGESLGQVARTDPAYLRTLAVSARRPDVRAAAREMLAALPTPRRRPRPSPSAERGQGAREGE
jgi:hypothetical protein